MVPVNNIDYEGSIALELETCDTFLVSLNDKVIMYCNKTYEMLIEFPIKLYENTSRESNRIIAIEKSVCEGNLAFISGKTLIGDTTSFNQLFIFKRRNPVDQVMNFDYEKVKNIDMKQFEEFNEVCSSFAFKNGDSNVLLFANKYQLFEFNI